MKKWLLVLALIPSAAFSAAGISIGGRDFFRIEVDDSPLPSETIVLSQPDLSRENHRLRRRLARLEQAVRALQDQVFVMKRTTPVALVAENHACYIVTPFDGTMTGKGTSEAEARGNVLKACSQQGGGMACRDSEVKCGGGA